MLTKFRSENLKGIRDHLEGLDPDEG